MAHFSNVDWRSPGDQWVRTESGWKRLLEAQVGGGAGLTQPSLEKQPSQQQERKKSPSLQLHTILDQSCVSAGAHSRESNGYTTISDAVKRLKFAQALYDQNCFPLICKVATLLFKERYWNLSGSMQALLLKICAIAKEITLESRKDSCLVLSMLENAVTALETGKTLEMSEFIKRKIDSKMENILQLKRQIHPKKIFLLENESDNESDELMSQSCDYCLCLSDDCLRHIVSYLSEPRDVLNFGLANKRLYSLTHENVVWRELTHYHYGKVELNAPETSQECDGECLEDGSDAQQEATWYQVFRREYELWRSQLQMQSVLCLCNFCHFVFWKSYGHPCCTYASSSDQTADLRRGRHEDSTSLTAESFLSLFTS